MDARQWCRLACYAVTLGSLCVALWFIWALAGALGTMH